ncbi:MAG: hypothetical protein WKF94_03660 [Solirubrobacteraceae bacterium]
MLAEPITGVQEPRLLYLPPHDAGRSAEATREALELARVAGIEPEPWEETAVAAMLCEREDGAWACREYGLCVPRQSGKGVVLEIRELAGLFLFGERDLVHSAHLFGTALEAFRRMRALIEGTPELSRRVKSMRTANGDEGIELHGPTGRRVSGGQRLKYRARTKGGAGRGLGGDFLALDEAMFLPEIVMGALLPVVSARPNAQIAYVGSAVDRAVHADGHAFSSVRRRALAGGETQLGYVEHSAPGSLDALDDVIDDVDAWAQGNPGLGGRMTLDAVRAERATLSRRTFAVERLGIGDWPGPVDDEEDEEAIIASAVWAALVDSTSTITGRVSFAIDVHPDRSSAAIAAAGTGPDGLVHVEVVEHRPGCGWVAQRAADLQAAHDSTGFRYAEKSPTAALVRGLADAGVTLEPVGAQQHAEACGQLIDRVEQGLVRHTGTPELSAAIEGASIRPLGDAWLWSRRASRADVTPLVAGTLAMWGVDQAPTRPQATLEDYRITRL